MLPIPLTKATMLPDATKQNQSPEYIRGVIESIGKSQRWIFDVTGISERRLRFLMAGERTLNGERVPVLADYAEQYILEVLADAAKVMAIK